MHRYLSWLGIAAVAAGAACAPMHNAPIVRSGSPCATDQKFQRLAFWIGDWDVFDSTGVYYATQRVRKAVDGCAITADWQSGGGNTGLGILAFDIRSGAWRQLYVSNQLPRPSGIALRTSDSSYRGTGVRLVSLTDTAAVSSTRTRVTIEPSGDHRVMELFEDSSDGGETWHVVFKAEHRPQQD
jgi:hypothetical protein